MSKMLYTVKLEGSDPSLEQVAEKLGITKGDLDEEYGLIEIDPEQKLYSVMVEESAVGERMSPDVKGPFSNPRIEPFGLEED